MNYDSTIRIHEMVFDHPSKAFLKDTSTVDFLDDFPKLGPQEGIQFATVAAEAATASAQNFCQVQCPRFEANSPTMPKLNE